MFLKIPGNYLVRLGVGCVFLRKLAFHVSKGNYVVMAGSINKVTLVGNLGRDPEVRTTQEGSKIVN